METVLIGPDFHARNSFAFGDRRAENGGRSAHDGRRDWGSESVIKPAQQILEISSMRNIGVLTALALALTAANSAQASYYCGACSYSCCPPVCCQPTCCYTTCKVERQTCYQTVYDTVCEPQQYTFNRTCYETVFDRHQETCYRTVMETRYRDEHYTVCKPICETSCREERYTVQHRSSRRRTASAITRCSTRLHDRDARVPTIGLQAGRRNGRADLPALRDGSRRRDSQHRAPLHGDASRDGL